MTPEEAAGHGIAVETLPDGTAYITYGTWYGRTSSPQALSAALDETLARKHRNDGCNDCGNPGSPGPCYSTDDDGTCITLCDTCKEARP